MPVTEAVGRPLPLVAEENAFFWRSGGKLRFQTCLACSALIHPPRPVCPRCRAHETEVREVSGRATLVGFTVNHRFQIPGREPPYVVAEVAVDEDPRVRLTTNIVESDPADLRLGMPVEVLFEQVEDVWLPLFRPRPGPPQPLPEEEIQVSRYVRPMVGTDKFEDRAAITGVGMSELGRGLMADPLALTVAACERAVADAGLRLDDIDGLCTYPGTAIPGMSEGGVMALEAALRLRPTWYNGSPETVGPAGSIVAAMLAVAGGLVRHVLCFRTVWQATHDRLVRAGRIRPSAEPVRPPMDWHVPFGAVSAAHPLGIAAQRHFHRYGTTRETLGWIALNQRKNAALDPTAIYRDPVTMDDYLSARPITTPFGLLDCDVPCDGAIAVVVSAVDAARDLAKPPVRVEAVGTQLIERVEWDQSTMTHEPQVLGQAAHLWSRSSLRPDDVDVALLYDGFTFNCLSWIEALGFCGIGEAKDFLDGGKNIARDGQLPLNTHGGQLSHGRTHGMGLVREAIIQLRGEGGERQVPGAQVAAVSTGGLATSGVFLFTVDS
jgi:acetyl-CoA acetyltransferase/uncharacterized OB-fold protein